MKTICKAIFVILLGFLIVVGCDRFPRFKISDAESTSPGNPYHYTSVYGGLKLEATALVFSRNEVSVAVHITNNSESNADYVLSSFAAFQGSSQLSVINAMTRSGFVDTDSILVIEKDKKKSVSFGVSLDLTVRPDQQKFRVYLGELVMQNTGERIKLDTVSFSR